MCICIAHRRKTPIMSYCFPYVSVDLRKPAIQPGISEHCETTDTGWCIAQYACSLAQLLPGTHSSLTTEDGLTLSRPGCLVLRRSGLPVTHPGTNYNGSYDHSHGTVIIKHIKHIQTCCRVCLQLSQNLLVIIAKLCDVTGGDGAFCGKDWRYFERKWETAYTYRAGASCWTSWHDGVVSCSPMLNCIFGKLCHTVHW